MKTLPRGWPRISQAAFYPDATQAIEFLRDAFGFDVRLVVHGEGGRVEHSELTLAGGVVMVAETEGPNAKPLHRAPGQLDGGNTQNMFIHVDDVEAHCRRARSAGAQILKSPELSDYGDDHWADTTYECADLAGHRWWFAQRMRTGSTYQPVLDANDVGASPPPKGWPRISSALYYADPAAAIDWLCRAFGFQIQLKVEGEGGSIVHSELVFGGGLIMVGDAARDAERWPHRREPNQIHGSNTQSLMLYVDDALAACEQARAAGAQIAKEPAISDYGEDYWADLSFEAIDVGGHRWWITERKRG